MKNLLLLTTLILVSCGGGGGGDNNPTPTPSTPTTPTQGTLLEEACSDTTVGLKVLTYADGAGGSYTEEEDRVAECGWDQADYNTRRSLECEEYEEVAIYGDGRGGTRETREENSSYCGYGVVTMVKDTGDRWDPVVLTYAPADLELTAEIEEGPNFGPTPTQTSSFGRLTYGNGRIEIYGTGLESSTSVLVTIGDEQESFQYSLRREPRCEHTMQVSSGRPYDCLGYTVAAGTPANGFIYYGEEDERIVAWELAFMYYLGDADTPTEVTVGSNRWNSIQKRVDNYNEIYERSGVHVRFILKRVFEGAISSLQSLESFGDTLDVDIILGWPYTTVPDSCGVAFPNTAFRLGQAVGGFSRCDEMVDLHEIGHAVGLAHGPRNQYNPDTGYVFPEFGHGENDLCANTYDDIMSYGQEARFFGNSKLSCTEAVALGREISDNPSGYRSFSETAYAINRVRYDVSLIYPERDWKPEEDSVLQFIKVEAKPTGRVPIID